MTLSRADAFLYEHTLNEDTSNRQYILRSEMESGWFMCIGATWFLEYIRENKKTPFYKTVKKYFDRLTFGSSDGYNNAYLLEELRTINEDKLYELLIDFVQASVSKEDFQSKRYAFLVWNGFDIHRYCPGTQDMGGSLNQYICTTKKPLPSDYDKTFSDGMQELIHNIRDDVNEKMGKEAISPEWNIIDDTILVYTALDSYLPWDIFLEMQEKEKTKKNDNTTQYEDIPWHTDIR